MGATHWDDADLYGDTEELLGKWFTKNPEKRQDIFLTTKFGFAGMDGPNFLIRSDPEYVKIASARSLSKLKTNYIDLYYCHRVDGKTPIEETVKALADLKNEGKIKYLGLSEVSASTLRRAHAVHPISALQIEYSPWSLDIETGSHSVLDTCKELGIAIVAYSPLGRGFLTGRIKSPADVAGDWRSTVPRFQPENFDKNLELVRKLEEIAGQKDLTSSQLVLAWLLKQWEGVHPLVDTRSVERVKENMYALTVKLSDEEDKAIRQACEACIISGARYPDAMADFQLGETPELTS
ncbi:uncharacterized protein Z518_09003 [Rhinocladiella mackenziei CBS 650.93]|uniref:Rhinocladiella mackenziei CBS 650.93 unplaced genomic scaffold supercont1.7, whole genome shotgun sequence n=1 Tax=Rhinocladiella mackenziei CBS 650.93 TaxID=1442369 RepID=A0A0D2GSE7_9EURO|nr:uncharacterized protein Z518_09003 [Rhinocladiella mackenziei CBS 650.93]KIX01278.1 hypothetical protein Z518_09003 [Rhinocladiella mackenziei CBS 650.93]